LFDRLVHVLMLLLCPALLQAGALFRSGPGEGQSARPDPDPADSLWLPELRVQGFVRPAWNDLTLGQADLDAFALGALDDVLMQRSALNLKDYGAGQLVTAGYRGGAARHTVLRWNGMRLNSPSHGTTDLSVLPLSGLRSLRLSGGTGASARSGSALGGLMDLETGAAVHSGMAGSLSGGWGSFGQWTGEGTMEYGMQNWQGRSLLGLSGANNDFPVPHPVLQDVRMPDAGLRRWYAVQDLGGRAGEQGTWSAALSGAGTQRNLPPGLQTTDQGEWQQDQLLLGAARYSQPLGAWQSAVRLGWLDESIRYRNQTADIDSDARSSAQEIGLEAGRSWHGTGGRDHHNVFSLDNQLSLRREQVSSSGFGQTQEFLELRMLSSLIWSPLQRLYLQADLLQDRYGAEWMPTQPVLRVHGLLLGGGKAAGPGAASGPSATAGRVGATSPQDEAGTHKATGTRVEAGAGLPNFSHPGADHPAPAIPRREADAASPVPYGASPRSGVRLEAGAGLARHYARPALNDRFWEPGGNPDLLPEQGWLADADARLSAQPRQGLDLELHGSAWTGRIEHWIQWTPVSSGWWQASNLHQVLNRGAELRFSLGAALGKGRHSTQTNGAGWKLQAEALYTRTQLRTASGDLLLYQPGHRSSAGLGLEGRGLRLGLRCAYTGPRPVQTDGSRMLPGFAQLGADLGYARRLDRWELGMSLQLDNLTNAYIESVLNRPQPGRSGRLVLRLSRLHKPQPSNYP
jgi:hypothetical protein